MEKKQETHQASGLSAASVPCLMTLTGIEEWQLRRSRFNHDWLKNRFLNRLDGFLALLSSSSPSPRLLTEFVRCHLLEWERQSVRGQEVIASFIEAMSPQVYLARPPLCLLPAEARAWLGGRLHTLWLARLPVQDMTAAAMEALKKADDTYRQIRKLLGTGGPEIVASAREIRGDFETLRDACRRLGDSLSAFPSAIRIV